MVSSLELTLHDLCAFVDVAYHRVCVFMNVVSCYILKHLPVCGFKAVLQPGDGIHTPFVNFSKNSFFLFEALSVGRYQQYTNVIAFDECRAGQGFVTVL